MAATLKNMKQHCQNYIIVNNSMNDKNHTIFKKNITSGLVSIVY